MENKFSHWVGGAKSPLATEGQGFTGGGEGPDGPTAQDLEIAGNLRTVLHRVVKILRRETRNGAELSETERSTLGMLYNHGELLPSDIAKMEKVSTQSVSQVVNHLFELNYIYKNPSTEDKRKVLLSLTPAGKAYVEQRRKDKQEWLAHALHEKVSPEEKAQIVAALKVLTKLVDE
jgi:DNA-binding MarR family transcriptional regulator